MFVRAKEYGFSYEIYAPGVFQGEVGPRIRCEDHFPRRSHATAAMRSAMRDAPAGSSAVVCKRYDDGETAQQRHFVKKESVVMLGAVTPPKGGKN
jgi:hypothetical protein